MEEIALKRIEKRIQECRKLFIPEKVISCLIKLLKVTNNGMVAYALGYEYEKLGEFMDAVKYYKQAESLFTDLGHKNMARFAINSLVIERLEDEKRKRKKKK